MKFKNKNSSLFFDELTKKVEAYFTGKGGNRLADDSIFFKAVFLLIVYCGSYFLLLSDKLNDFFSVLLVMLMGAAAVMIVFNIVHDASHKVLFKNPVHNRLAAYLGDLMGINSYMWNIRHNILHHSFTNVAGGDILLDNIPLLRISPFQKKLWIHRLQVWYVPLLYAVYSIFWVFILDFNFFIRKNMGNYKNIRHSRSEWVKLFFFKFFYVSYMILIPWLVINIPIERVLIGFLIYHVTAGILLSTAVVMGHCVEGLQYVAPDEKGIIHNSWMQHEWDTTSDFATDSRLIHWITGGLNTHLAHHLFPKISHCHYYDITRIIKKHCEVYKIEYPHYSFGKAIISHFCFLRIQARV